MVRALSVLFPALAVLPVAAQCEIATLQAKKADSAPNDYLGWSCAIEGDTVVAGMPRDDPNGQFAVNSGSARVFERGPNGWSEVQKLVGSDTVTDDRFGQAVALAGGTLFVSSHKHASVAGAVYVFEHTGSAWVEVQKLVPTQPNGQPKFGLALASDGTTLVVGAPGDDRSAPGAGAAYVFERNGNAWLLVEELPGPPDNLAAFGKAVAVDGQTVVVGAPMTDGTGFFQGTTFVYERVASSWQLTATLFGEGVDQAGFGQDVAVRFPWILVASSKTGTFGFENVGGQWVQLPKPPVYQGPGGPFAFAAPGVSGSGFRFLTPQGVWSFEGTTWDLEMPLQPLQGPGSITDYTVIQVDVDGHTLVRGYPGYDDGQQNTGAVAVDNELGVRTYCTGITHSGGCVPQIAATGAPKSDGQSPFTIWGVYALNNKPGTLFYGLQGTATIPFLGGTLCVQPPLKRTPPVFSGGNPPPEDCSGSLGFAFGALIQSGSNPSLSAGQEVRAQWYLRDPLALQNAALSDALEFVICP